jgi:transposase
MSEPLIRRINREQMLWRAVDVEQLIGEDHAARAIWELVGRLRLDGFYEGIECSAEEGGRPAYDPRLLISLWIYAYSQGAGVDERGRINHTRAGGAGRDQDQGAGGER